MPSFQGSFKFSEVLTYVVRARDQQEAEKKLRQMQSAYWKLDPETIAESASGPSFKEVHDDK